MNHIEYLLVNFKSLIANFEYFMESINSSGENNNKGFNPNLTITFKCYGSRNYPKGDNRIFSITGPHNFDDIYSKIKDKYDYMLPVLVLYKDSRAETVTIDSDSVYQRVLVDALTSSVSNYENEIKFFIKSMQKNEQNKNYDFNRQNDSYFNRKPKRIRRRERGYGFGEDRSFFNRSNDDSFSRQSSWFFG